MERWGSRSAQTRARAWMGAWTGGRGREGREWGFALEFESVGLGLAGHVCTREAWGDAGDGGDDRCDGRGGVECEKARRRRRTTGTKKAKAKTKMKMRT